MRPVHLFFLSCLFTMNFAFGQKARYEVLTTDQGIISNHIDKILVDQMGFLWMASYDGVQRWDGLTGINFHHQENDTFSLPDNIAKCLLEDNNHNIWIGTLKGLCYYSAQSRKIYRVNLGKTQVPINDLSLLNNNRLLIASSDGVAVLDLASKKHQWLSGKIAGLPTFSICKKNEKEYWLGTLTEGVFLLNTGSLQANPLLGKNLPKKVNTLFWDQQKRLWVGALQNGLTVLNQEGKVLLTHEQLCGDMAKEEVRCIYQNQKNEILVGIVDQPLLIFNEKNKTLLPASNLNEQLGELGPEGIFSMCEDQFGNLWLASHGLGLFRSNLHKSRVAFYPTGQINAEDAGAHIVTSVEAQENGVIWVGTDGGGLIKILPDNTFKVFTVKNGLSSNSIQHLSFDGKKYLWIATAGGGLIQMNVQNNEIEHIYRHSSNNKNSLPTDLLKVVLAADSVVYIGTHGEGLAIYHPSTKEFFHGSRPGTYPPNLNLPAWTNHLFLDQHQKLWIATSFGLYRMDPKGFKVYQKTGAAANIGTDYVNMLAQDENQNLYAVGESGGLQKYLPASDKFIPLEHPRLPATIKSIWCGKNGKIWMGTNEGVVAFDSKSNSCEIFNVNHGFQGKHFFHKAIKAAQNKLLIGGLKGLNVFSPQALKIPFQQLRLQFETAEIIDDKGTSSINIGQDHGLAIPAAAQYAAIRFAIPNLYAPEDIRIRYRLNPLNSNWIDLSPQERKIVLNGLPPNNYELEIQYSTNGQSWIPVKQVLAIHKLPYWWETSTFNITLGILLLVLVFLIIHLRTKAIQARNLLLKKLVKERTIELEESHLSLSEKMDETIIQNEKLDELNMAYQRQTQTIIDQQNKLLSQNKDLQELVTNSGLLEQENLAAFMEELSKPNEMDWQNEKIKIALFKVENDTLLTALLSAFSLTKVADTPEEIIDFSPDFILIDQHFNGEISSMINHLPLIRLLGQKALIAQPELIADLTVSIHQIRNGVEQELQTFLAKRRKLKAQFSQTAAMDVSQIALHEGDQEFMDLCMSCIDKNLSNPDLTSDLLQEELALSRTVLYGKIKQLTDLGVHEFIRSIRLKKSIPLLQSKKYTVSQVAYEVGFSSPSYYIRCFTKQFGKSPKEYVKGIK